MAKNIKLNENESILEGKLRITEQTNIKPNINHKDIIDQIIVSEAKADGGKKLILKPRIEAIHAGRTRNGNIYLAERLKGDFKLKSGVYSFLYPYPKPMIKNHDHESEPTGRIRNAQFITDSLTNKEAILIIPEITDPDTIEKILDGRYMTVSIGATTDSAICNICGTDILKEGWCGHDRGEVYDGVECGWIIGNLFFDECSWVNVPADTDAMIVDAGEPIATEAYAQIGEKYYNLSAKDDAVEIKESAAKMLGIYTEGLNESEGGMSQMDKKLEDATVEDLTEDNKTQDNVEKDTAINEQLQAKEAELAAVIAEKDSALAEKQAIIAEKETKISEFETKIAELQETLNVSEAEKTALTEEVANLKSEKFKTLVERVIDYKQALGRPLTGTREEAIEEYLARSEESLNDTLKDLMQEFSIFSMSQTKVVTNPAGGAILGENNSTIVDAEGLEKNKDESLTTEQVLRNLFKGSYK